jgi:hypothetical protein
MHGTSSGKGQGIGMKAYDDTGVICEMRKKGRRVVDIYECENA